MIQSLAEPLRNPQPSQSTPPLRLRGKPHGLRQALKVMIRTLGLYLPIDLESPLAQAPTT
jgi:hypothetical protein